MSQGAGRGALDAPSAAIGLSELSSGLRLATERMVDVHSVAMGFWVGTGSRDEDDARAGSSHFLEHLLFKGTASRSARAIAEAVDEVGGDCNAFTTKEYTAFYIRLLAEHLELGLDILCDIMQDPALRPADVEAERSVILDEILMHADEPADLAAEGWSAALFPGHSLGRDTLGTAESVSAITPEAIRSFFADHYRPGNIVVSVAGDCFHDRIAEELEARYRLAPGGGTPVRQPPGPQMEPLRVVQRSTEQAHLVLGARALSRFDEDRWALAVLNHVLGGGLSSRLFQKVREARGLAYSIWSETAAFGDTGSLAVAVGTAPANVKEVLFLVVEELDLLAREGISSRELAVAQASLRADTLLAGEDSGTRMSRLGSSVLLHDEVRTVDQILAKVAAVDLEDVARVAARVASAPRCLSVVGPFEEHAFDPGALGLAGG